MRRLAAVCAAAVLLRAHAAPAAEGPLRHDLAVRLDPAGGTIEATDTVTFPAALAGSSVEFLLHEGLEPAVRSPGATLEPAGREERDVPAARWRLRLPEGAVSVTLAWKGAIRHPLRSVGEEYARGQRETPGTIDPEGVFLSTATLWHPLFAPGPMTFALEASLPAGWDAVSQGKRAVHRREAGGTLVRWESAEPQEEIWLVAGPWTEVSRAAGGIEAMVFLRGPDAALAGKYLDATFRYVRMYSDLLGPYPYPKWALVENFWETGYGMPSFTLLGPKVLRFPFILTSSYPHEILHSWWGNGVSADYASGNWGEGLTAYLSDHLFKEQQGAGAEYRQATLQKYADYVLSGRDLPLTEFRSRHGSVTEAVGYGKSLMLFHMLRRTLGDDAFRKGLQGFYRAYRFKTASWADLRRALEEAAGRSLETEFRQFVERPGAPRLRVAGVRASAEGAQQALTIDLEQTQEGEPYRLAVPVAVTLEGSADAFVATVSMEAARASAELKLPALPLRVDVDPEFDLFRRLDRREIPPAISQALGAERALVVLPSRAPEARLAGYRKLAEALRRSGPGSVEVTDDAAIAELPADRSPWLLGWENRFLDTMRRATAPYDAGIRADGVRLEAASLPQAGHAFVLAGRHPANEDLAVLWIALDDPASAEGLGRKLPHYHKYSYLAFSGAEPENVARGRWPVVDSPLSAVVAAADGSLPRVAPGRLPKRQPLASLPPQFSEERLGAAVRFLASDDLEGRGFGSEGLEKAAAYVAAQFAEAGLAPAGDAAGSYFQSFTARGGDPEREAVLRNVVGVIPGTDPARAGESVVIGAHYDHLGRGWPEAREGNRGRVHPGADDNASGVAVLIELARALAREMKPARAVVFAAFAGEEAGKLGSRHYVAAERLFPASKTVGMVALDSVGRPKNRRLLVLGCESASEWVHIFRGAGYVAGVDTAAVSEALDASDQVCFQDAGVPAVQLTTGPHPDYHRPSDTADKIDSAWLAGVAAVAREAVEYLAGRPERLSSGLAGGAPAAAAAPREGRKVSLGVVPDFSFAGPGVRLDGTVAGSPAEQAGLRAGDVLVGVNGAAVADLKGLNEILHALSPGAELELRVLRGGSEQVFKATLKPR